MPIQLNIQADTATELLAQLNQLVAAFSDERAPAPEPAAPAKPSRKAKAPDPTPTAGTATEAAASTGSETSDPASASSEASASTADTGNENAATADAAAPTTEASAPAAAVRYADVRSAMINLTTKKNREVAAELLKTFEVAKAQDLDEARWPELIAAANAAAEA